MGFDTRRGHWKAEEYKKFAFPSSEVVLDGLLPEPEFEIWTNIARCIFTVGALDGHKKI